MRRWARRGGEICLCVRPLCVWVCVLFVLSCCVDGRWDLGKGGARKERNTDDWGMAICDTPSHDSTEKATADLDADDRPTQTQHQ
jgi:hypothetical protein